jgi:hypothetical protein
VVGSCRSIVVLAASTWLAIRRRAIVPHRLFSCGARPSFKEIRQARDFGLSIHKLPPLLHEWRLDHRPRYAAA